MSCRHASPGIATSRRRIASGVTFGRLSRAEGGEEPLQPSTRRLDRLRRGDVLGEEPGGQLGERDRRPVLVAEFDPPELRVQELAGLALRMDGAVGASMSPTRAGTSPAIRHQRPPA